jgi:hypothetical protein
MRGDLLNVHLVAHDDLRRPVPGCRRLPVGQVGSPDPLVLKIAEAGVEAEAEHFVQTDLDAAVADLRAEGREINDEDGHITGT